MLIGALLIGLLTAYYFGLKPGIIAAGVCALLFILAATVPGISLSVYGLVGLFIVGVCLIGPRMQNKDDDDKPNTVRRYGKRMLGKLWKWL